MLHHQTDSESLHPPRAQKNQIAPTRRSSKGYLTTRPQYNTTSHSPQKFHHTIRQQIYEEQDYKCAVTEVEGMLQLHHIVPRCKGGNGYRENGVALAPKVHKLFDKLAVDHNIYFNDLMLTPVGEVIRNLDFEEVEMSQNVQYILDILTTSNENPDIVFTHTAFEIAAGDD